MMNDTFMKEKPVLPLILSMSLPMVLSMLVNSLYNIVDSFFRRADQRGGYDGIIVGLPGSKFYQCCRNWIWRWDQCSDRPLSGRGGSQKSGSGSHAGTCACRDSWRCYDSLLYYDHAGFPADVHFIRSGHELGVRYSIVAFAFTLIVTVSMTFEKLFQAVGNMKTTMISLMCGCITNIVLDPVLIFGYGPFPEMGIEGAALATGIGQALTLTIYLVVYLARPIRVHIRRQYILPSKKMVIKLYSIGIPATLNLALPSLFDFGAQCDFGGIFRSVYSGFGNLLQIADICLSSSEWHCAGDAPP